MLSLNVSSTGVKPTHIAVLKFLALRGATKHPVNMSSEKLAEKFDVSQQSGSRYILNLVDNGLLERNLGRKGQILSLTSKAIDILKNEFNEYRLVFDAPEKIMLRGKLESGLGEGAYYISRKKYQKQINKIMGWEAYDGTFNLRVKEEDMPKLEAVHAANGMLIEGFKEKNRTFGRAWLFEADIVNPKNKKSVDKCAVIVPKRTHYRKVIEIISPEYLRGFFKSKDDQEFIVNVKLNSGN